METTQEQLGRALSVLGVETSDAVSPCQLRERVRRKQPESLCSNAAIVIAYLPPESPSEVVAQTSSFVSDDERTELTALIVEWVAANGVRDVVPARALFEQLRDGEVFLRRWIVEKALIGLRNTSGQSNG
ncbi:hypothetical protein [Burkholderia pyrrocinia]|uniref:hypothetical protein n=1 Tax=Burkholderia pyrrocinia TaxID=60550 RepID=UPI001BCA9E35|nr:hypothetical protein [Burkholderia pyrrocinia]QVN18960.1 hypothetical protein JYG32_04270 [Burkholderia pyrrocinia]